MPINLQATASVLVCRSVSDMFQPIYLFRYDPLQKRIYILAGVDEGIEIIVFENGREEFDIDE